MLVYDLSVFLKNYRLFFSRFCLYVNLTEHVMESELEFQHDNDTCPLFCGPELWFRRLISEAAH